MYFSPKSNGWTAVSWSGPEVFTHQYSTADLLQKIRSGSSERLSILQAINVGGVAIEEETRAASAARFFPDDFRALLGSPRLLDEPGQPLGIQLKCLGDDFVYQGGSMGLFEDQPGSVGEVEAMALLLGWDDATSEQRAERQRNPERFIFAYTVCYELGHNGAFLSPPTPVSALRFASASGIKSGPQSLGIGSVWYVSESDDPNLPPQTDISIALYAHGNAHEPQWQKSSTFAAEYYGEAQKNRTAAEYVSAVGGANNTHLRRGCVIALGNAGANNGKDEQQQLKAGNKVVCKIGGLAELEVGFSYN